MNAVRHAEASRVQVALLYATQFVHLKVSDDGQGFDPEDPHISAGGHWGLTSMRERVRQIEVRAFEKVQSAVKGAIAKQEAAALEAAHA